MCFIMTKKWCDFYRNRINSSYQEYFEERYKPFLNVVNELKTEQGIFELGCGIGSVSKAIEGVFFGIDKELEMVKLANENTSTHNFFKGDIFTMDVADDILKVTHGVLEHFSDEDIVYLCEKHINSVHYVPLDKYVTPSFGDERLLPFQYWVDLVKPKYFEVFNDGHDLVFTL